MSRNRRIGAYPVIGIRHIDEEEVFKVSRIIGRADLEHGKSSCNSFP